jgi:hypothetical protein
MASDRVVDVVAQQGYEEMLSYEMRNNTLLAGSIFSDFNQDGEILIERYLFDDVYKAGLSSGNLLRIDTENLISILPMYSVIPIYNELIKSEHESAKTALSDWYSCLNNWEAEIKLGLVDEDDMEKCKLESEVNIAVVKNTSTNLLNFWSNFYDLSATVSANFTPTQNRLKSPILRSLMGTKTLEILK